jgi:prevent-host-death family protein
MTGYWQLQEAKRRFSQVVEKAVQSGPQIVTKRGVDTVVVLSVEEYRKLTRYEDNLIEFFNKSPLKGISLDLERDKRTAREVDF